MSSSENSYYVDSSRSRQVALKLDLIDLVPVSIGTLDPPIVQTVCGIAIGDHAGYFHQGQCAVAIGREAGETYQGTYGVALGVDAGAYYQGSEAIAVGMQAGQISQGSFAVAIGVEAGQNAQAPYAIAIGAEAGGNTQGANAIAIGRRAGQTQQVANSIILNATGAGLNAANSGLYVAPIRPGSTGQMLYYNSGTDEISVSGVPGGSIPPGNQHGDYLHWDKALMSWTIGDTQISLGSFAGASNQASNGVALGYHAGEFDQQECAIAIGVYAGQTSQSTYAIAIGCQAGQDSQFDDAVAVGPFAGQSGQGTYSIAIGKFAGQFNQPLNSIILNASGAPMTGTTQAGALYVNPVRTGSASYALFYNNSTNEVLQGSIADNIIPGGTDYSDYLFWNSNTSKWQVDGNKVHLGTNAGKTGQAGSTVALGVLAGNFYQGTSAIAVGYQAGQNSQGTNGVAIGLNAGQSSQAQGAIAIGLQAGQSGQRASAIAIGRFSGQSGQQTAAIAIGVEAGSQGQQSNAIAIGVGAGFTGQQVSAVAIGDVAGQTNQQTAAIAIGLQAGQSGQRASAIAIGRGAGAFSQGSHAIAIGTFAGQTNQPQSSIVLNASGATINTATQASALYINPIRNATGPQALFYEPGTSEVTYANPTFSNLSFQTYTYAYFQARDAVLGKFMFTDCADKDAFYRLRVSQPSTLFEGSTIYDNNLVYFDNDLTANASITGPSSTATMTLTVNGGSTANQYAARQSHFYAHYQPGKSFIAMFSFSFGPAVAGITKRVGFYDVNNSNFNNPNNGVLLEQTASGLTWYVYKGDGTSQSAAQAAWNVDPLNGSGPSGINLNAAAAEKNLLGFVDLEWLGVGRVRVGFFINGVPIICNVFNNTGFSEPYINNPLLPIRYEVRKTNGTAATGSLNAICCTILSEGGFDPIGIVRTFQSNQLTITGNEEKSCLAIRLLSGYPRAIISPLVLEIVSDLTGGSNVAFYSLYLWRPSSSAVPTGAVWAPVSGTLGGSGSFVESSATELYAQMLADTAGVRLLVQRGSVNSTSKTSLSAVSNALLIAQSSVDRTNRDIYLVVINNNNAGTNKNYTALYTWREI